MAVRPAHAGDPINKGISASDWNALNEMRRRKSNASIIGTTATDDALDGIVTVKNTTGNNLPPGSIVGLDEPFILPDGTSDDARLMLNFQGVVPTDGTGSTTDYTGRFGILLDGVSGEYGAPTVPARIFDCAYCKLYMQSATDQFADIEHNNTTRLKSGSSGSAQILYHYPMGSTYPQETYGYVRLGNKETGGGQFCYRTATTYGTTMAATLAYNAPVKSVASSGYYYDDSGSGIAVTVPGWYRAYGRARFNLEATTGNHEFVNATGGLKLQIDGTDVPRSNRQCSLHQEQLYYMYSFSDTHTQYTVQEILGPSNVQVQGSPSTYTTNFKTITIDDLIRELVVDMPVELEAGEEVTLWSTSSVSGTYTSATMRIGAAALMGQYFGHEAHLALEKL